MDQPHDQHENATPPMPDETELLAVMDESDRDVASGRTVPLADVLAELDRIASETEARRARRA
jgi:hypothetical protein